MKHTNETQTKQLETLSQKIVHAFSRISSKVLLIVSIESILVASILIVMYTSQHNQSVVEKYTTELNQSIQAKVSMLETIAAGIDSGTLSKKKSIATYVDTMVTLDDQISAVYSCYDKNVTIMSGGWEPPEDFVVTEREWYINAQKNPDKVYISDPYVDLQSGGICITLSKATYKNGKVVGVVGMDMYINDLVSLIEQSYSGNRYVFLTTEDGTILVHPNKDYTPQGEDSTTVKDANHGRYEKVLASDMSTKTILDYKGGLKCMTANTSDITGWKVISVEPLSTLMIFLSIITILYIVIFIVTQMITKKFTLRRVDILFKPLESISKKISLVAQGDLSIIFDEEKNSKEIASLTDSLNETIQSLHYYIESIANTVSAISDKDLTVTIDGDFKGSYIQIKESLEKIVASLNDAFHQIQSNANHVLEFSSELEKSTESVAESASQQNISVSEVATEVNNLNTQTKQITTCALNIKTNAEVTNQHLQAGTSEMKNLILAMEQIEDCSEKIADFVVEINNIAEQTNLLALNASIEAARAGESGKGFAVVANEISTLASSSAEASANITSLIQASKDAVLKGKELVSTTSSTMEQGVQDSVASKDSIEEIVDFVKQQQSAIETINNALTNISRMVENTASSAQENTAISQSLNESAETLNATASAFELQ